jgi:hypothetical protein
MIYNLAEHEPVLSFCGVHCSRTEMTGFPRGLDGGTLTEAELEIALLGQGCGAVKHN